MWRAMLVATCAASFLGASAGCGSEGLTSGPPYYDLAGLEISVSNPEDLAGGGGDDGGPADLLLNNCPTIAVNSPAAGTMLIGDVVVDVEISSGVGIVDKTVAVTLGGANGGLGGVPVTVARVPGGNHFKGTVNVRALSGEFVFPVISVSVDDKMGRHCTGESLAYKVDFVGPAIELTPKPISQWVVDQQGKTIGCSYSFDPVGNRSANEGDAIEQLSTIRARVEDRHSAAPGLTTGYSSLIRPKSVKLYLLPQPSPVPLVIASTPDHICDDINPTVIPKQGGMGKVATEVGMGPLSVTGAANFFPPVPLNGPGSEAICNSMDVMANTGDIMAMMSPKPLCGDLTIHLGYTATRMEPSIYSLSPPFPAAPTPGCDGTQFDAANSGLPEGPLCAAVVAWDNAGNRSVSRPIHLCYDLTLLHIPPRSDGKKWTDRAVGDLVAATNEVAMTKKRATEEWAAEMFGGAEFGDARLSKRLVRVAADLAGAIGTSPGRAAGDDEGAAEAAYRFVRNERVKPSVIAQSGFAATAVRGESHDTLLCIEDTTTLSFTHHVESGLGDLGGPEGTESLGLFVHSALVLDARTGATVGLVGQDYWMRDLAERGKRHERKKRAYNDKESFKWQRMSERVREQFGDEMAKRVIATCDREADIYEYLAFKTDNQERFVVRASWDRNVEVDSDSEAGEAIDEHLFAVLGRAPKFGESVVQVPQRGGRPARTATLTVRAQRIRLRRPQRAKVGTLPKRIAVNAVLAREESPPPGVEPLEWLIFTSEPIFSAEQVLEVLRLYRLRWRIEEFHKAWKSGAGVERRRMQTALNIKRISIILAFVAVRLLQLRERHEEHPDGSCAELLTAAECNVLWVSIEKTKPPRKPPTIAWAYRAIARLGGWHDSKRTGRVGWDSYWIGWLKLQERVEGYEAALLLSRRL